MIALYFIKIFIKMLPVVIVLRALSVFNLSFVGTLHRFHTTLPDDVVNPSTERSQNST